MEYWNGGVLDEEIRRILSLPSIPLLQYSIIPSLRSRYLAIGGTLGYF
jgi:hypothetical protein